MSLAVILEYLGWSNNGDDGEAAGVMTLPAVVVATMVVAGTALLQLPSLLLLLSTTSPPQRETGATHTACPLP